MGAYLGIVAAPTAPSQYQAGDRPKPYHAPRSRIARAELAAVTKKYRAIYRSPAGSDDTNTDVTGLTGVSQTGGVTGAAAAATETTGAGTGAAKSSASCTTDGGTGAHTPLTIDSDDDFEKWSQCGLEDDEEDWEDWEGPQRIRQSLLTAEERAKFQGHLDRIFSKDIAVQSERFAFTPSDVYEVMEKVIPYLDSEPMLIEDIPFDISIVADLHGQLYDLHRVFKGDAKDGKPGWECRKYVFLGDYVDRGRQSLEIIMALFCIKMLRPDDIFLLRGNHEFLSVNLNYGLAKELNERYHEETAEELFFLLNEIFCYLSVGAIVGDVYLCVHGGISPMAFTRDNLRGIYKPFYSSGDDVLVHDMVWADPAEGLEGTVFNGDRGWSHYFGMDMLAYALESMEVKVIIRGHTRLDGGYEQHFNCLVSLFTCTDSGGTNNDGAVAVLDNKGRLSFRVLVVCPKRREYEKYLAEKAGHKLETDGDPKTKCDLGEGSIIKMGV